MIRVAILTVSDSASTGHREDLSGPLLQGRCQELGWQVAASEVLPDDEHKIRELLFTWADSGQFSLILTTGGTGISARDFTPEATRPVLEKELPGVSELIRTKGLDQTPFSALSRGLAGTRKNSLIVNLPGSPKGAVYSLKVIEHLVPHILRLLAGDTAHGNSMSPADISKIKI
jgi:molybdopterin adenylyltransferase